MLSSVALYVRGAPWYMYKQRSFKSVADMHPPSPPT